LMEWKETGKLSTAAFELSGLGWAEFVLLGQALVNRTEENYCSERAKSKPFPNLAGDG
jgi:hypothetical protein